MNTLTPHTIERMSEVINYITNLKALVKYIHTIVPMGKRNKNGWIDVEMESSSRKNAKVVCVVKYDNYKRIKCEIKSYLAGDLYTQNIEAYKKFVAVRDRGSKLEKLGIV